MRFMRLSAQVMQGLINAFKKTITICIVSSLNPVCFFFLSVFSPGGFAKVKLGRHILTGEKVAIKIMNKKDLGVRNETGNRKIGSNTKI